VHRHRRIDRAVLDQEGVVEAAGLDAGVAAERPKLS